MKIITFGCRLNTFESATINKMELPEDLIIVNTCAITSEAERQCRQSIRKLKRENPSSKIVVTGCAAQVHPEIYAKMPEVDKVLGNREKLSTNFFTSNSKVIVSDLNTPISIPTTEPIYFEGHCRAYIQIQQGCSNHCTFCIVPQTRGPSTFLPQKNILNYAKKLINEGFKEINITGVDITDYPNFSDLIFELSQLNGLERLRLGSIDPACIDDNLINVFSTSKVLQPYIHLSAQSGDNLILKRMGRRHSSEDILSLCSKFRSIRPDMTFGADFITGFPTETNSMFENTCKLVEKANITHLHVFPYSERSGTPAEKMPQIPKDIRKKRASILRKLGDNLLKNYMDKQIGKSVVILAENDYKGLCEHYLPVKVDSLIEVGKFYSVLLKSVDNGVFKGSVNGII